MNTYSILIPHHNNITGLDRLLESIYQPRNNDEIFKKFLYNLTVIIVDDYSNAITVEKLFNLREKYGFLLINNYNNKGAGICRNIAFENANTDYIIFSDSDDIFTDDYYLTLLKFDKINVDILYFKPYSVYDSDMNKPANRHIKYVKYIDNYLKNSSTEKYLRFDWPAPWSKRFSLKFIKNNFIKFDDTLVANDIMFSLKSGYYAKEIFASTATYYIATSRKGSLETNVNLRNLKTRIEVGAEYHKFCDSHNIDIIFDYCFMYLFISLYKYPKLFLPLLKYYKKFGYFDNIEFVKRNMSVSIQYYFNAMIIKTFKFIKCLWAKLIRF